MRRHSNGTRRIGPIEQAMAVLLHNQAVFVANLDKHNEAQAESNLRFARIEKDLDEIKAVLKRHEQILTSLLPELLAKLPEEVSRKIGFKPKP